MAYLPRSNRGLTVGLSWAAYLGVSEASVQVIPKCAHQWLTWKHVGPISKVLLQSLLLQSSWCAPLSLPQLHAGHEAALPSTCCAWLGATSLATGVGGDRTRAGQCHPFVSCFTGLSSSRWPVCRLLERCLLSAHLQLPRLADMASKAQNFATQGQPAQSVTMFMC